MLNPTLLLLVVLLIPLMILLHCIWMSPLRASELHWIQYQINLCIAMGSNTNTDVWMYKILQVGIRQASNTSVMFGCHTIELTVCLSCAMNGARRAAVRSTGRSRPRRSADHPRPGWSDTSERDGSNSCRRSPSCMGNSDGREI